MADQSDTNNTSGNKPKNETSNKAQDKPKTIDSSAVITPAPPKTESKPDTDKKNPAAPLKSDNNVKKTSSVSDNAGVNSAPKAKNENNSKPAKTGFLWFVTIINLLILLLIVAAAYWGWTQWDEQKLNQETSQSEQQDMLNRQAQQNHLCALLEAR